MDACEFLHHRSVPAGLAVGERYAAGDRFALQADIARRGRLCIAETGRQSQANGIYRRLAFVRIEQGNRALPQALASGCRKPRFLGAGKAIPAIIAREEPAAVFDRLVQIEPDPVVRRVIPDVVRVGDADTPATASRRAVSCRRVRRG